MVFRQSRLQNNHSPIINLRKGILMANLLNRFCTRSELLNYIGDQSQIGGIKLSEWAEGVERGPVEINIPAYTLRNYQIAWEFISPTGKPAGVAVS
jgi:hypothetical protein